jgi:hypothetical protein
MKLETVHFNNKSIKIITSMIGGNRPKQCYNLADEEKAIMGIIMSGLGDHRKLGKFNFKQQVRLKKENFQRKELNAILKENVKLG